MVAKSLVAILLNAGCPVVYAVVVDTNCLQQGVENDFSCSWIESSLASCCDIIESRDAHEQFKFLIPEIVVREVRSHQLERHKASVEKIQDIRLPQWTFEYDKEGFKDYLDDKLGDLRCNGRLGMVNLEVVALPDRGCLERLVDRVLEKRPPFSGAKKETDKGFKDALIWESILGYKEANRNESIILASADGLLGCDSLKKEFKDRFSDDLIVVRSMRDLENTINELIENLGLGFPSPSFANEYANLESVLKAWLSRNLEVLVEIVSVEISGSIFVETAISYLEIDKEDGGFKACATMRFENEDSEIDVKTLELSGCTDGEYGWLLEEITVEAEPVCFNEPLGFFGDEERCREES